MDTQSAATRSRLIGVGSLAIGAAATLAPERFGRLAGTNARAARTVGIADLAVAAGLVAGRNPRSWMFARAGLNVGIAAHLLRVDGPKTRDRLEFSARRRAGAAALGLATLADLRLVAALGGDSRACDSRGSAWGRLNAGAAEAMNRRGIYLGRRSTKVHVALYRRSGGRLGAHVPGWPDARVALVDHRGARSGIPRTSPLMYHEDGSTVAVVASKAGQRTNPAWFHNLMAHPETTVQIGSEVRAVRARAASAEERARLWPEFLAFYPGYAAFRERAQPRTIPIVLLEPRPAD